MSETRKTNGTMLRAIQRRLQGLEDADLVEVQERVELLQTFERRLLDERILADPVFESPSRSSMALEAGLSPVQAEQLERRMLRRVTGVLNASRGSRE